MERLEQLEKQLRQYKEELEKAVRKPSFSSAQEGKQPWDVKSKTDPIHTRKFKSGEKQHKRTEEYNPETKSVELGRIKAKRIADSSTSEARDVGDDSAISRVAQEHLSTKKSELIKYHSNGQWSMD